MINVKVSESLLFDLLVERVKYWTNDEDVQNLYIEMYKKYINDGLLEGIELDINQIVDNDYVNNCEIVYGDDNNENIKNDYNLLIELYNNNEYNVSCNIFKYYNPSYIEAVDENKKMILIRY